LILRPAGIFGQTSYKCIDSSLTRLKIIIEYFISVPEKLTDTAIIYGFRGGYNSVIKGALS